MISIEQVSFSYGEHPVLEHVDLAIPPGRITGLFGKNGVGKTTLLRLLCGLLFPREGRCSCFGRNPARREPTCLSDLFFLPEEFALPPVTGRRYTDMFAPFYPAFSVRDLGEYVERLEVDVDAVLTKLSHGQRKKFMVAFALATNCRLLLLDEPTNGLDIPSKTRLRAIIPEALGDDTVCIVSTHQARDLQDLINHVVILDGTRVVFDQTMRDVRAKLSYGVHPEKPDEALWAEPAPGGYQAVSLNREDSSGPMDLEALFNTVITVPERVGEVFA
ncbi:MAG: ATP-binding cassette domain-containing protein [Desulfatibacillaceae bacterium]